MHVLATNMSDSQLFEHGWDSSTPPLRPAQEDLQCNSLIEEGSALK